jgi:hypothetical protein
MSTKCVKFSFLAWVALGCATKKWKFLFSGGLFAYFLPKQKVRIEKN